LIHEQTCTGFRPKRRCAFLAFANNDRNDGDIDPDIDIYPIMRSKTDSICSAVSDYMQNDGHNCTEMDYSGDGICYQTSFGDWKCLLPGSRVATRDQVPPPR
jgi:hypothetical protein